MIPNFDKTSCICAIGLISNSLGLCVPNCIPPYYLYLGVCQICPVSSSWDSNTKTCVCNPGFRLISNSLGLCVPNCIPPYYLYLGVCQICPVSSSWDSNTKTCVCNPGFTRNYYGICISNCPVGSSLSITGGCYCLSGYYSQNFMNIPPCYPCTAGCLDCWINGCRKCALGWNLVGKICMQPQTCNTGYFLNNANSKC
jgi:hypothetical protein